ncbi:hypothetical protein LY76DRAFT_587344 [Colletotrichum caudatum]|nr:hypothetical protein LY76DRAFT_587344 [Colletotrichum caudatum]
MCDPESLGLLGLHVLGGWLCEAEKISERLSRPYVRRDDGTVGKRVFTTISVQSAYHLNNGPVVKLRRVFRLCG